MIGMSVLGGGPLGQGVPMIADLIERISPDFEIAFYSFNSTNTDGIPKTVTTYQTVKWKIPEKIKHWLLAMKLWIHHLSDPYSFIYAVSVFPTGQIAIRLGKILRRPVVVQLISLEAVALTDIGYGNLSKPWLRKITEQVCRDADELVVISEFQREVAQKSLPTSRRIHVLPCGIDIRKFPVREKNIEMPVRFIHVAYYHPIKDQTTLFTAFARIAAEIPARLVVVGAGFEAADVLRMLNELNIADKVSCVGNIPQVELPRYYADAHIMLHTSRFEAQGTVTLEAMASGVVVCATDVGGLAGIDRSYAITVPPKDAEQLAKKTIALIHDPLRYKKMQSAALDWVKQYDADLTAEKYRMFFEAVANQKA